MEINKVLVVGSGTMGRGIAQWFAQQGVNVELIDAVFEVALSAQETIHHSWHKLLDKGKFSASEVEAFKKNLKPVEMSEHSHDCDLVIEAIIENLDIKRELFQKIDLNMKEECIIASNTSSIPITTLARDLSEKRKKRTLGLHFFNPAPIMKLVEIIQTPWLDKQVSDELFDWFSKRSKKPAICQDSPGFIVNRVARSFYGEALHILENHNQERIEELDRVMTSVGGFRMGPFTLMDLIGIDVNYDVTQSVWKSFYNEPRFRPHRIQREMVESGRTGRKTQEGFYKYEK
ncbi:3-hydroxyacyl-CoA dehydrogenase NAD-binding domain-containing protein [Bacteriovorax sp. DB6_IX]|uniref:3-hydroxyacyl-CoA dehydrogenase NAD-binding domain-containing protein n=1 Tax=Bacteriovorax sp. DB6_IX TaxID=1353530 RepID=UPI00038A2CE7|nr:3-hydroxyacyl-CoA dehydrogenase NAD-binding domain-containing protein [Bacteriovorax sp. DB6_IX]EQC52487.1 3-hydroxyacyl-CoA dehydrogenase, NAD binding domain protein [Bacteriovorax sp. DB6_IX]